MIIALSLLNCGGPIEKRAASPKYVKEELEKLAPVEIRYDIDRLTPSEQGVLAELVKAGQIIDELFLLQVDPQNVQLRKDLEASRLDPSYLELFDVMFGPWNRLDEDQPFIAGRLKPDGAGFYPEDMNKEEFYAACRLNHDMEQTLTSNFTLIKRQNGALVPVPYHEAYGPMVQRISEHLNKAAELTDDTTLEKYLRLRAKAFLTDDYFDSDMAWMDLSGDLEVVIGPYEVYEDNLFGYKAAYEAFICVVDHEESEKLATAAAYLDDMESNLPIPDEYKNFNRGSSSPIKVVHELFTAGDTKAGIQTTAFNLPNDERVREAKGSKKVMLKNVAQAKYEKCWIPIVKTILAEKPLKNVSFGAYFSHTLMHEISHGLGPGTIIKEDGSQTSVNKELKDLYSVIEECKADVLGIYNQKFLMDKGIVSKDLEYSMFASNLGGMLRSIRFGIDEAHGGGVAIQMNYYFEKGAYFVDEDGKLDLDPEKIAPAVESLARELLLIEAKGDYKAAQEFVGKYRYLSPVMKKCIEQLAHVPVDIRPSYPAVKKWL